MIKAALERSPFNFSNCHSPTKPRPQNALSVSLCELYVMNKMFHHFQNVVNYQDLRINSKTEAFISIRDEEGI